MSKDASIGWMYEGEKGNVHREDYLLGKKVDKNFEKYSDVVNAQKAEAIDTIVSKRTVYGGAPSSGLKTSSLQKDIIKSEDPFVAVKVREETKRREIMDNPLMKVRLQNMLKSMMTSSKRTIADHAPVPVPVQSIRTNSLHLPNPNPLADSTLTFPPIYAIRTDALQTRIRIPIALETEKVMVKKRRKSRTV
uniref:Uncharacterized protein n=1 Tax=Caenorhabditis japonica TaxID=281687 RepID=A0A8R1EJN1_CAEJA